MSRFRAQDGFVHFVFANNKDCYFLPSLVRLDLNSYLYYQLKDQGYEGIFFVSGMDGEFLLSLYDEDAREIYRKHGRRNTWGLAGIFSGDELRNTRSVPTLGAADTALRLTNILKKSRNLAFVFRLDCFCEIFGENRDLLTQFSRTGHKYLEQNGNILVLQAPMTASGSLPYLTDRNGVFARSEGTDLCTELRQILEQEHAVKLYEQLSRDLGRRCVFLNTFSRENMELLVKSFYLVEKPDEQATLQDVRDLSDFLWAWYASVRLRRITGPILSENETRHFSFLLKDLQNTATWLRVHRAMDQLRSENPGTPLRVQLSKLVPTTLSTPRIPADSLLARKMKQVRLPEDLYASMPELGQNAMDKFAELTQEYQTPRSRPLDKELENNLLQCLNVLENAATHGDIGTFERAVQCLSQNVNQRFTYTSADDKLWQRQMMILQLSERVFNLEQEIRDETRIITDREHKKKTLMAKIQELRRIYGHLEPNSPEAIALDARMREVLALDEQVRNQSTLTASKQHRRTEMLGYIHNLELAMSSVGLGNLENVEDILRDAVENMQRDAVMSAHTGSQLEELSRTMSFVVQEGSSSLSGDSIAAEYEKLLSSLEEAEAPILLENL
ncbi:MAG: hypothetical protein IJX69_00855 [Oscillospiraceae bacterium]|nr:hypothetical protein [Oscillospiraceae bacterium]